MQKVYRHLFGWLFIILGILGLFLPFLQGILFLIIGAIILAPVVPFFGNLLIKVEKEYPGPFRKARLMLHRIMDRLGKGMTFGRHKRKE